MCEWESPFHKTLNTAHIQCNVVVAASSLHFKEDSRSFILQSVSLNAHPYLWWKYLDKRMSNPKIDPNLKIVTKPKNCCLQSLHPIWLCMEEMSVSACAKLVNTLKRLWNNCSKNVILELMEDECTSYISYIFYCKNNSEKQVMFLSTSQISTTLCWSIMKKISIITVWSDKMWKSSWGINTYAFLHFGLPV